MRKNQIITVNINDIDANGFGIGRAEDGLAVFVEYALPGDRLRVRLLKIKPRYAYAKIEKILAPSPHRTDAGRICPVFSRCGGCQWMHCDYASQLLFKRNIAREALMRIGKLPDPCVAETLGMANPLGYRCKAQFPVGRDRGNDIRAGFYAPRSHRIVPVSRCPVQHPSHGPVLEAVMAYVKQNNIPPYNEETKDGLLRHIVIRCSSRGESGDTGPGVMAALVINGKALPREKVLAELLKDAGVSTALININTADNNVILGAQNRVLFGSGFIHENIGNIEYRLSLRSFFQVNPAQAEVLYKTALEMGNFSGTETIIDAHSGVGGMALYAAGSVKFVYAVELMPEAVADAEFNAELNNIKNARFIPGAAEDVIPDIIGGADAIFLDPPRKGCAGALVGAIIASRIPKIIYISCDPATLARDVRLFTEGGYAMKKARPVDLFPMTGHVETVCLLTL